MIAKKLEAVIKEYGPENGLEQENVLQEIMQRYILSALSRAGFFKEAVFHGGTCLRIIFNTNRFSEDLDFFLLKSSTEFRWEQYLENVHEDCAAEGIDFEITDKTKAGMAVQKAFLKTDSIGKILELSLPFTRYEHKKVRIKLEIDTDPPEGSSFETRYITFPVVSPITIQSLHSGFALKTHALICRSYTKGRDWYDFVWYINYGIKPDMHLLKNALFQQGPWAGKNITITSHWLSEVLEDKIRRLEWRDVRRDIERFIPPAEQLSIMNWSVDFFLDRLRLLENSLQEQG